MTFFSPSPQKTEEFRVGEVCFLGEQDGPPERLLKDKLAEFFHIDNRVIRAYLARIRFGEGTSITVALALRTQAGPDEQVIERIGSIFASIFNAKEHLDIMFLTDDQERQLRKICNSFYEQCESG